MADETKYYRVQVSDELWKKMRTKFYLARPREGDEKILRTKAHNVVNGKITFDGKQYTVTEYPKEKALKVRGKKNVATVKAEVGKREKPPVQCHNCGESGHKNKACRQLACECARCGMKGHKEKWCTVKEVRQYLCTCDGKSTCDECRLLTEAIGAVPRVTHYEKAKSVIYEIKGDNLILKLPLESCYRFEGVYENVPSTFKRYFKLSTGGYGFSLGNDKDLELCVVKHLSSKDVAIQYGKKNHTLKRTQDAGNVHMYDFPSTVPRTFANVAIDDFMHHNSMMAIFEPVDGKLYVFKNTGSTIVKNPGLKKGSSGLPVYSYDESISLWSVVGCVYGGNDENLSLCMFNSNNKVFDCVTQRDGEVFEEYSDKEKLVDDMSELDDDFEIERIRELERTMKVNAKDIREKYQSELTEKGKTKTDVRGYPITTYDTHGNVVTCTKGEDHCQVKIEKNDDHTDDEESDLIEKVDSSFLVKMVKNDKGVVTTEGVTLFDIVYPFDQWARLVDLGITPDAIMTLPRSKRKTVDDIIKALSRRKNRNKGGKKKQGKKNHYRELAQWVGKHPIGPQIDNAEWVQLPDLESEKSDDNGSDPEAEKIIEAHWQKINSETKELKTEIDSKTEFYTEGEKDSFVISIDGFEEAELVDGGVRVGDIVYDFDNWRTFLSNEVSVSDILILPVNERKDAYTAVNNIRRRRIQGGVAPYLIRNEDINGEGTGDAQREFYRQNNDVLTPEQREDYNPDDVCTFQCGGELPCPMWGRQTIVIDTDMLQSGSDDTVIRQALEAAGPGKVHLSKGGVKHEHLQGSVLLDTDNNVVMYKKDGPSVTMIKYLADLNDQSADTVDKEPLDKDVVVDINDDDSDDSLFEMNNVGHLRLACGHIMEVIKSIVKSRNAEIFAILLLILLMVTGVTLVSLWSSGVFKKTVPIPLTRSVKAIGRGWNVTCVESYARVFGKCSWIRLNHCGPIEGYTMAKTFYYLPGESNSCPEALDVGYISQEATAIIDGKRVPVKGLKLKPGMSGTPIFGRKYVLGWINGYTRNGYIAYCFLTWCDQTSRYYGNNLPYNDDNMKLDKENAVVHINSVRREDVVKNKTVVYLIGGYQIEQRCVMSAILLGNRCIWVAPMHCISIPGFAPLLVNGKSTEILIYINEFPLVCMEYEFDPLFENVTINNRDIMVYKPSVGDSGEPLIKHNKIIGWVNGLKQNGKLAVCTLFHCDDTSIETIYTSVMRVGSLVYYEKWDCDIAMNQCLTLILKNKKCDKTCRFIYGVCGNTLTKERKKQCNGKVIADTPCRLVSRNNNTSIYTHGCDVQNHTSKHDHVKKEMWKAIGIVSLVCNAVFMVALIVLLRNFCWGLLCAFFCCFSDASALSYQTETVVLAGEITGAYLMFVFLLVIMMLCLARVRTPKLTPLAMVWILSTLNGVQALPYYNPSQGVMISSADIIFSTNTLEPSTPLPTIFATSTMSVTSTVAITPQPVVQSITSQQSRLSSSTVRIISTRTIPVSITSTVVSNTTEVNCTSDNTTSYEETKCFYNGQDKDLDYFDEFSMVRRSDRRSVGCTYHNGVVSCLTSHLGHMSPPHAYVVFDVVGIEMLTFDVDELDYTTAIAYFTYQACGRTDIIYPECGNVAYLAIDNENKTHAVMSTLYSTGEVALKIHNWCLISTLIVHAKVRDYKFDVKQKCHLWIHNEQFNPIPFCEHDCLYPRTVQTSTSSAHHTLACVPIQVGVWCGARHVSAGFVSTGYTNSFTDVFGRRLSGHVQYGKAPVTYKTCTKECPSFHLTNCVADCWGLKGKFYDDCMADCHGGEAREQLCLSECKTKHVNKTIVGSGQQIKHFHSDSCNFAVFSHRCSINSVVNDTYHTTSKGKVKEYSLFIPSRVGVTKTPYSHRPAKVIVNVVGTRIVVSTDTIVRVTFNNVTGRCNDVCNYDMKVGRNYIVAGNNFRQYYHVYDLKCTMDVHDGWYTWFWYQECVHRPLYFVLLVIYWVCMSVFTLYACCRRPKTDTSMAASIVIKVVSLKELVGKAKADDGSEIEVEDVYNILWLLMLFTMVIFVIATAFKIAGNTVRTISVYRSAVVVVLLLSGCCGIELASSDYAMKNGRLTVKSSTIMGIANINPDVISNKFMLKFNIPGRSITPVAGHFAVVENSVVLDVEFLGYTSCYKTDVKCDFSCSSGGDNFIPEGDLKKKFVNQRSKAKTKLFRAVSKCLFGFMKCFSCGPDNNYRVWWYSHPTHDFKDKRSYGALYKVRETNIALTAEVKYGDKRIRLRGSAKSEFGSVKDGITVRLSSVSAVPNPLPEHIMVFDGQIYDVDVPQYGAAKAGAFGDLQFRDPNGTDFEVRDAYIPSQPNSKKCAGVKVGCGFSRWIKEHKISLSHRDIEGCELSVAYEGSSPKFFVKNCKVGTISFTVKILGIVTPVYDKQPTFKITSVKQKGTCRYSTAHYCNLLLDFTSDDDYECTLDTGGRATNVSDVKVKNGRNLVNVFVQALGTHDSSNIYLCGVQFYGSFNANPPQAHVKIGYNSTHDGDVSSSPGQSFRFDPFGSPFQTLKSIAVIILVVVVIITGMVFCFKINKKSVEKFKKN